MGSPLTALISQAALSRGVDPRAALAVAGQEGLSGRVGDNGTSFGPFQLHFGGAYPSEAPQQPNQAQAWASSPAGVNYAMNAIAKVAGGLHGPDAVRAIVSQFERPADVAGETQRALQGYGGTPGMGGSVGGAGGSPPLVAPQGASGITIQGLLGSLLSGGGDPTNYLLKTLQGATPQAQTQTPTQPNTNLFSSTGYQFPVQGKYTLQRVDQGQDFAGTPGQHVVAIGNARVDAVKDDPGGFGKAIYYTLLSGPDKGKQIYVGHAQPTVQAGQTINAGEPVATLLQHPYGTSTPGWTEIGYANNGVPAAHDFNGEAPTSQGEAFANFLKRLMVR